MSELILQAIIIAIGNFSGILAAYYLLDRRTEGKINKYWRRIKTSPEGEDVFTIAREVRALLKSDKVQGLFKEAYEVLSEVRALLKMLKEKAEADESDEESPRLPTLDGTK